MTTVPARTAEQRADALAKALATRQAKASLRQDIKAGHINAAAVVTGAADNPLWASLRVSWLLEALPGVGPIRAERIMGDIGIAPSRRIQGLGERQRDALLRRLGREHA